MRTNRPSTLKTRPQKPFSPTPILQSLAHIPHISPFWSFGGLGGNPKVLRLSACTRSVISKDSSGFSRIHRKQTPSLPDMRGERSPQSRHCPKPCTDKTMERVVFSCCYGSFLKGLPPLIFFPTKYMGRIKTRLIMKIIVIALKFTKGFPMSTNGKPKLMSPCMVTSQPR